MIQYIIIAIILAAVSYTHLLTFAHTNTIEDE